MLAVCEKRTETAQQIAVPHGIPWNSGKRQPPSHMYIYIIIYIYVHIMKYYGNPLYHIIATNNKANKIRINHNQPTCKSPTTFFPPNNSFFPQQYIWRIWEPIMIISPFASLYGSMGMSEYGVYPEMSIFMGKRMIYQWIWGCPKKTKKVNERNCPCQPASHWPEPAKREPTFPGQSSIPPERPWDPAGRQQMDCHHHSHHTCWGKAPEKQNKWWWNVYLFGIILYGWEGPDIKYHQIWKHRRDTHNCSSHHNCSSRSRSPYNRFLLHPHSCIRNLSPCEQPSTKENNASNLEFPKSIPLKKYVKYSQLHNATNPSNSGNSLHHRKTAAGLAGAADASVTEDAEPKASVLQGHIGGTCSHDNLLLRKKTDVGHIEWGWFNEDLMDLMLTLSIFMVIWWCFFH